MIETKEESTVKAPLKQAPPSGFTVGNVVFPSSKQFTVFLTFVTFLAIIPVGGFFLFRIFLTNYLTFDKATMYAAFFAVFMVNVIVVIYIVYVVKDPSNFSNKKAQDIKKE